MAQQFLDTHPRKTLQQIAETEGEHWSFQTYAEGLTTLTAGQNLVAANYYAGQSWTLPTNAQPYFTSFYLYCNRDLVVSLRTDDVTGYKFKGDNDNLIPNSYMRINTRIALKANVPFKIDKEMMMSLGWPGQLAVVLISYDTTDSPATHPVNIYVNAFGYLIPKLTDVSANLAVMWMGDSITRGTGSTPIEQNNSAEHYSLQVTRSLKQRGYRFRPILKAQSSMTTSSQIQAMKWGYYDAERADLIINMIGANDVYNLLPGGLTNTTAQATYKANLTTLIKYNLALYPNAKILMLGTTPSHDDAQEAITITSRTLMQQVVTTINNPNVKYGSLATAFDRTNTANYLPGDNIHPTAQNAISAAIMTIIDGTGWYPSLV